MPAQNLLASKYKAVGILEEFNTTLHLFNRALELPNYDWLEQYARGENILTALQRVYIRTHTMLPSPSLAPPCFMLEIENVLHKRKHPKTRFNHTISSCQSQIIFSPAYK